MSGENWIPGPWETTRVRKKSGAVKVEISSPDGKWWDFARVWVRLKDSPEDDPQGVANAHLIAAAPELYEALDLMLKDTDGWDETQLRVRYTNRKVDAILAARAALRKARGE